MDTKTLNACTINVVRLKDWVIPYDADAYKVLYSHGITPTRIKFDVFDTVLSLKLRPAKVKVNYVKFDKVWFDDFLDKVARNWAKIPSTKITNTSTSVTLTTTHPGVYEEAKATLEKAQAAFDRFSTRWGTSMLVTSSESRGKLKMHVEFRHGAKPPVVSAVHEPALLQPVVIDFGFLRVELLPEDTDRHGHAQLMRAVVKTKTGSEYATVHSTRFLRSDLAVTTKALEHLLLCKIKEA